MVVSPKAHDRTFVISIVNEWIANNCLKHGSGDGKQLRAGLDPFLQRLQRFVQPAFRWQVTKPATKHQPPLLLPARKVSNDFLSHFKTYRYSRRRLCRPTGVGSFRNPRWLSGLRWLLGLQFPTTRFLEGRVRISFDLPNSLVGPRLPPTVGPCESKCWRTDQDLISAGLQSIQHLVPKDHLAMRQRRVMMRRIKLQHGKE